MELAAWSRFERPETVSLWSRSVNYRNPCCSPSSPGEGQAKQTRALEERREKGFTNYHWARTDIGTGRCWIDYPSSTPINVGCPACSSSNRDGTVRAVCSYMLLCSHRASVPSRYQATDIVRLASSRGILGKVGGPSLYAAARAVEAVESTQSCPPCRSIAGLRP